MAASDQAELTIDLAALAANYKTMQKNAGKAETSAVVKADGYGLGMAEIAPVLFDAGCRSFWVAQLNEGIALRAILPEAKIYVLNGVPSGTAAQFETYDLRPCLVTLAQVEEWQSHCQANKPLPACLFVDSGFNRLGFGEIEIADLTARPRREVGNFNLTKAKSVKATVDKQAGGQGFIGLAMALPFFHLRQRDEAGAQIIRLKLRCRAAWDTVEHINFRLRQNGAQGNAFI